MGGNAGKERQRQMQRSENKDEATAERQERKGTGRFYTQRGIKEERGRNK